VFDAAVGVAGSGGFKIADEAVVLRFGHVCAFEYGDDHVDLLGDSRNLDAIVAPGASRQ
jgi:hypothetical protein